MWSSSALPHLDVIVHQAHVVRNKGRSCRVTGAPTHDGLQAACDGLEVEAHGSPPHHGAAPLLPCVCEAIEGHLCSELKGMPPNLQGRHMGREGAARAAEVGRCVTARPSLRVRPACCSDPSVGNAARSVPGIMTPDTLDVASSGLTASHQWPCMLVTEESPSDAPRPAVLCGDAPIRWQMC